MDIDVVVIGLNCAATLEACLAGVREHGYTDGATRVFYVDGGSADESLAVARRHAEITVLPLTPAHPAPGLQRNAGWRAGTAPLVLFLDADTTLASGFLTQAAKLMTAPGNERVGAVFGLRRERRPEASIYNWIGDHEWNPHVPDGKAVKDGFATEAFGGDVLTRRAALEAAGGYDPELVGGEDPELAVRMRLAGWDIRHIPVPMTTHDLDANLARHCRRAFRTGYGFAAVAARHARHAGGFWLRELTRIVMRGGGALALGLAALYGAAPLFCVCAALLLLLYPSLFRVDAFMKRLNLSRSEARRYALHCSLIVLPQFLGVARYFLGALTGSPLRNNAPRPGSLVLACLVATLCGGLAACAPSVKPRETPRPAPADSAQEAGRAQNPADSFSLKPPQDQVYATPETLQDFARGLPEDYLLGPGDVLSLQVWNRENLSDPELVVAPDGTIAVMRIGFMRVEGRSLEEVTHELTKRFAAYYTAPEVRLVVRKYKNNRAYVLGRVSNPGLIEFTGKGTLLEALSLAGGLSATSQKTHLTKCAVIRGRDQMLWIDLRDLLQRGNLTLNTPIRNNDVIFIPENEDELVYIMGEVATPGALQLKPSLTYLDALMLAGGPTRNANLSQTYIIRHEQGQRVVRRINLQEMLERGDTASNFLLKSNDIVYVVETGMASFNYKVMQLLPALEVINLGTTALERFGVMQDLRRKLYGTPGFISGQ